RGARLAGNHVGRRVADVDRRYLQSRGLKMLGAVVERGFGQRMQQADQPVSRPVMLPRRPILIMSPRRVAEVGSPTMQASIASPRARSQSSTFLVPLT